MVTYHAAVLLLPVLHGLVIEKNEWLQMLAESGQHCELGLGDAKLLLLRRELQLLAEFLKAELHNLLHLDAFNAQAGEDDRIPQNELRL